MSEGGYKIGRNELVLSWHRGASTMRLEGFQTWVLLALKPQIRFEQAIWGLGVMANGIGTIHSAYLHRLEPLFIRDKESLRHCDELAREVLASPGRAVNMCLADAKWGSARFEGLRAYAERQQLCHLLCFGSADTDARAAQFIALGRAQAGNPFSAEDVQEFESLAPHMLQAYATRREMALGGHQQRNGLSTVWVTAIIDRAGHVHNRDTGFVSMLQREWSDFDGRRLPGALSQTTADRSGTSWRHLGEQIILEFSPVHDLYLVFARRRFADDALSERERKIAQHYASGSSYKEIAQALQLSPATVRAHVRNVFIKLGVNKKAHLARLLP
jgi:DNA-binding CsgD family transcriptional regulator